MVIGKSNQTGGGDDTTLMGRPSEVWVDPADNEVFVADGYGNRRVIVFDGVSGGVPSSLGRVRQASREDPPARADAGRQRQRGSHAAPFGGVLRRRPHRRNCASRTASPDRVMVSSTSPTGGTTASRSSVRTVSSCERKSCARTAASRNRRRGFPNDRVVPRPRSPSAFSHDTAADPSLRRRRRHPRHHGAAPERPGGGRRVRGSRAWRRVSWGVRTTSP